MYTSKTTGQLSTEQERLTSLDSQILKLESHSTIVDPKGDISLLGTPQDQHDETYPGNSEIKSENREAVLWLFSIINIY